MTDQWPEHGTESRWSSEERREMVTAILVAVLLDAAIIGLFMFITWVTYATD